MEYLDEHGAQGAMQTCENKINKQARKAVSVNLLRLSDSQLAVMELLRKQKIKEQPELRVPGCEDELNGCVEEDPTQNLVEIFGEQRDNITRSRTCAMMNMLLEPKKDGRRKGRLVVRGDMEPGSWTTGPTDSPVASGEAVRTLIFSGEISGEAETLAMCDDAKNAFRQTQPFGPDDPERFVACEAHKHAKLRVFKMLSSQHGCTDASGHVHAVAQHASAMLGRTWFSKSGE